MSEGAHATARTTDPVMTLTALLLRQVRERPAATALFYGERVVTYTELYEESRRLANGLAGLGVGRGDVVALWMPNTPAWLAALFACARLGAIALATNTRFRSSEMGDILARSGAKVLMLWPSFRHIDFTGILRGTPAGAFERLKGIVAYEEERGAPLPDVHGIAAWRYADLASGPPMDEDVAQPDIGCLMFTTSGTTKAPKFVLHHQRSVACHAIDDGVAFEFGMPGSVTLGVVPLCGTYGFSTTVSPLLCGTPVVLQSSFSVDAMLAAIRDYGVTCMNLTGDMVGQLLSRPTPADAFRTVRYCGCGSGSQLHVGPCEDRGLTLIGLYGSSEMQALFSRQSSALPSAERCVGGGLPVSSFARVRATHPDTGEVLPHGESGALEMSGPSRFSEYFANPQATAEAFTADGFFRTGDLGYTLEDGRFVYQSRMGDVLRLSGFLVSPPQIEGVVLEDEAVDACQVVGLERDGKLRPVAFVIMKPGARFDEAALIAFCRERMARYKVPERIIRLDAFPVTTSANGVKVQKAKLRDMAAELAWLS